MVDSAIVIFSVYSFYIFILIFIFPVSSVLLYGMFFLPFHFKTNFKGEQTFEFSFEFSAKNNICFYIYLLLLKQNQELPFPCIYGNSVTLSFGICSSYSLSIPIIFSFHVLHVFYEVYQFLLVSAISILLLMIHLTITKASLQAGLTLS